MVNIREIHEIKEVVEGIERDVVSCLYEIASNKIWKGSQFPLFLMLLLSSSSGFISHHHWYNLSLPRMNPK